MTHPLKNCPCCGGDAGHPQQGTLWRAACKKCGMRTPWCLSKEDAIEHWNTRAAEETIEAMAKALEYAIWQHEGHGHLLHNHWSAKAREALDFARTYRKTPE